MVNVVREYEQSRRVSPGGVTRRLSLAYVVDRISHVLVTGSQWRNLEVNGGSWKTIHHYFVRWSKANLFKQAFECALKVYVRTRGLSEHVVADTSFIKNVYGTNCVGPSPFDRGRKATKVSVITDAYGVPLIFTFHPGNKNDSRTLQHTIDKCSVQLRGRTLYADKIYDSRHCSAVMAERGIISAVSKKRTQTSADDNRKRIVVEHTFSWLDKFRRILVRFEQHINRLASFHYMAGLEIVSRRLPAI